ncbi:MAM and LDL-receptor class A domain-containing protein 1 [Trichonephila clavipes]|uniref:MAM and LDL-receptor class A domain-containing protein 1 n=1 Tax=Trichonephila clavipes TaxID=2585209 RepID=A0A8X6SG43_TRICX|nr:MAM and LDL-receptor class A domain-containing protein 1 [Trichonephila clavipes]
MHCKQILRSLITYAASIWGAAAKIIQVIQNKLLRNFQFIAFIKSPEDDVVAIDDVKLITGRCPETGFCDFEEDICSWKYSERQYKWDRIQGLSEDRIDNTLGTNKGFYIRFSSKDIPEDCEATFESEIFPPDENEFCLTFYCQMSGKNLGALKVLKREGTASNSTLWVIQGDQEKTWKKGMANIQPTVEEYQIIFQGIISNGTVGFMAIDDIRIRKGELCKITPREADPLQDNLNTTHEPFNYTYDFITSSKPSNYTYDFNSTYEPINSTYYRTTPALRTTLKHGSCDHNKCLYGSCKVVGQGYSCYCQEGYSGAYCDVPVKSRKTISGNYISWFIVSILFMTFMTVLIAGSLYFIWKIYACFTEELIQVKRQVRLLYAHSDFLDFNRQLCSRWHRLFSFDLKIFRDASYSEKFELRNDLKSHRGLAVSLEIICDNCGESQSTMSSKISNKCYDINLRLTYGMRAIGKGGAAARIFCGLMNLPPSPAKFESHNSVFLNILKTISENSMNAAVHET